MKKLFALMFLICSVLFSPVIHSCKKNINTCGDRDYSPKFHANKLSGYLDSASDSVLYSNLIITLNFSGEHYTKIKKSFDLFPSAYACSPVEPYTEERITDIVITADVDFDDTHPAGSDLKDFFEITPFMSGSIASITEYLDRKPFVENAYLQLVKSPDVSKDIRFTVTYHFEGKLAKKLSYQTSSVRILSE